MGVLSLPTSSLRVCGDQRRASSDFLHHGVRLRARNRWGCARSQRAALINAVTVIIRESRIDVVSLKAARGPRPRRADHTMLCRFFRLRRRRHIVGVGVAAAGEITERAAQRSDGRLRRWDQASIAIAHSRPGWFSARSRLPISERAGEHGNRDIIIVRGIRMALTTLSMATQTTRRSLSAQHATRGLVVMRVSARKVSA